MNNEEIEIVARAAFAAAFFHPNDADLAASMWENGRWPQEKQKALRIAQAAITALDQYREGKGEPRRQTTVDYIMRGNFLTKL